MEKHIRDGQPNEASKQNVFFTPKCIVVLKQH